ncbi:MAG: hypothetical protein FDX12_00690 [Chlorobium sp.]|nr:MAG: hypothetical protein FDX12_00690 [Chlorobium sp.]
MYTASVYSSEAFGSVSGVTVTVTPDSVLVGDRIHCTIGVKHSAKDVVTLEGIDSLSAQPLEIINRKQSSVVVSPGTRKESFEFEFAVFGSGRKLMPPFTVVVSSSEGKEVTREIYRPSSAVFIKALTDSSMRELRPIKPPMKPSIPLLLLLPVILGMFGIAGFVLLMLFLLKRKVRSSAEKIDPGQVAQRKLRKLGSRLSAGMPPPECYEELSNIMRTFLEKHYRIRALEAVTQEIERDLKKLGVAGFESIMNLLAQADLVKFADSRPDAEESRQSLRKAEEVIRSTRTQRSPEE